MPTLKVNLRKTVDQSVAQIFALQSSRDVANFLEVSEGQLLHILYHLPAEKRYRQFEVPKKNGGVRSICSPVGGTKILQQKLRPVLCGIYRTKSCVHGFTEGRSIVTNATLHRKRRYVLNFDLQDFFPSINFGRIRGLFMSKPFSMGSQAATLMARICTFDNQLPQGAPTSPVLSNLIAADLDKKLIALARRYNLTYSRYADDITFSTTRHEFPRSVARYEGDNPITGDVLTGDLLRETVVSAGFQIHPTKTRMQIKSVRQEVTGLTVNEFPNVRRNYVRNIRAMLNAWRTYGLSEAEKDLVTKYSTCAPNLESYNGDYFKSVIYGRLAFLKMVRGGDDLIYMKLCLQAAELDQDPPKFIRAVKVLHKKFDVFICHASEDKDTVARPIYEALESSGMCTFLDEKHIVWGDSLTEKINHALGRSRFVLAILSVSSVDKVWPQKEINSALARELAGKQKILPLIVGDPDLSSVSLIEDKLHVRWDGDAVAVAKQLREIAKN